MTTLAPSPTLPSPSLGASSLSSSSPSPTASSSSSSSSSSPDRFLALTCAGHDRPVPRIRYSPPTPDGDFLISSCHDAHSMIREGRGGEWLGTLIGHKGAIWDAQFNSLGNLAVTASADFSCKVWDPLNGDELATLSHKHIVRTATWSTDSNIIYTGGHERKIRLFDINNLSENPMVIENPHGDGQGGIIMEIIHLPEIFYSSLFCSISNNQNIQFYDRRTMEKVRTINTTLPLSGIQLSHDNTTISYVCGDNNAHFLTLSPNLDLIDKNILTIPLKEIAECISFDGNSNRFATGSSKELWIRVYEKGNGNGGDMLSINKGHHGPVRSIDYSWDGKHFASGSVDGTIRIWSENPNWKEGEKEKGNAKEKEKEGKEKEKEKN